MTNSPIKTRIFLVSCPRSGTTLLQSLLAAHPEVASFPESHLFQNLWMYRWSRLFGLASFRGREQLNWFLREIDQEKLQQQLPKNARFIRQYGKVLQAALDNATQAQGKSIWLEKSPEHVCYIRYIEASVADAKFIHLIRNGSDVVASLYDVTRKYRQPDVWGDEPWELDKCIHHWVRSIQLGRPYYHKPNHILVRYEKLVENPESILRELCDFIETSFNPIMLEDYGKTAEKVILKNEAWKASVAQPINNANSTKFYQLFTQEQQQYILNNLSVVNLDQLIPNPS
jgi:hypothetical protein